MPYTIPFSDPNKSSNQITVNDLTENITSTSLSLVGRNYSNYGVSFAKNFVHLLENFASPNSPNNSIEGQVWYDSTAKRLFVNDSTAGSSNWRPAGGTHVAPTAGQPSNPLLGDLWVNTLTQQLSLYNGIDWILVGPTALSGKKSGVYVENILDGYGASHFVTVEYNNDVAIKITASEAFIPQRTIEGFTLINPGINITTKKLFGYGDTTEATTSAKIYGTSTAAESLNVTNPAVETVLADNFARRDIGNSFYGQQSILNDAGLTIGQTSSLSLSMVQGTVVLKNSFDAGNINFVVSNNGAQNIIFKIDGQNKRVGINHTSPNVELDVNGSAYISGTLTATGVQDSTTTTTGALQIRGGAGIAKSLNVGKNIVSNGHLRVGEINASNEYVPGPAIIPNQHLLYDIGTTNNRFKTIYAERFDGSFGGTFTGTVTGSVIGAASSLANSTNFTVTGDVVTTAAASFNGAGGTLTLNTSFSENAIRTKTEVIDNRPTDTLLVYRENIGLRRVTRTNFLLGEAFIPIGTVFPYAATTPPLGYLLCDGALVARTEYPYLYQVIGTTYGSAAGGSYFRLPDLRGRFALGNVGMANALSNVVLTKSVAPGFTVTSTSTISLVDTDNLYPGMFVTSSNAVTPIPSNTIISTVNSSTSITISSPITLTANATMTFTLQVIRDTINSSVTDRVSNVPGNNSPSNVGSSGGASQVTENIVTSGSSPVYVPTGSASNFNTTFNVNVTNPYLTLNYIIRVGVASTQL
jgi:microcystin-dependent protein